MNIRAVTRVEQRILRRGAAIVVLALFVVGSFVSAQSEPPSALAKKTRATLFNTVGNPDPGLSHRVARALGPGEHVTAYYEGIRLERLAALDATTIAMENPLDILPSLAALMGAKDRQTAARASHALHGILHHLSGQFTGFAELVPGQAEQLTSQLVPLVLDPRLDLDVRGVALDGVLILEKPAGQSDRPWLKQLLEDDDPSMRQMAIGVLTPPLSDTILSKLVSIATEDTDPVAKGNAAAMLCENAYHHNVKDPSDDLAKILRATLGDATAPVDAMGGILACLRHFEGNNRTGLVDLALSHPDPFVKEYWTTITGK